MTLTLRASTGADTGIGGIGGTVSVTPLALISVDGQSRISVERIGPLVRSEMRTSYGWIVVDEDVPSAIAGDFDAVVRFWVEALERRSAAPVAA